MRFRASALAQAVGGRLLGADVEVDGASFDSRTIRPGELFVPLVAERDGHDFVDAAVAAGAAAYLTSRPAGSVSVAPAIEVADTAAALLALATWARSRLDATVVGVTGSVGKTTTKDLIAGAVAAGRRTAANVHSFNNEQGLPVTVLGAPDDTEVLVVEMGMRGPGEIARLCTVARPDIGVVTRVASAHTARVGGLAGVARAKAELVQALPESGFAVLNADDHRVAEMALRTVAEVVTFGHDPLADVRIEDLHFDERARPRFLAVTPWGRADVALGVSGEHMAVNACAALAVAGLVGVEMAVAAAALEVAALSAARMELVEVGRGGVVVNDAYNANPASMAAALRTLAAMRAERRVAVLGAMAELDDPGAAHAEVAALAAELRIELVAVATPDYGVAPSDAAAVAAVVGPVEDGTVVLVKASNAAGLRQVAADLVAANAVPGGPAGDEELRSRRRR